MLHLRSRLRSSSGNATLEFVLFFASGLLLIVTLSSGFEQKLRASSAALAISNDALRAFQVSADPGAIEESSRDTAAVFNLPSSVWSLVFEDDCAAGGRAKILVTVRGVTEFVQGSC